MKIAIVLFFSIAFIKCINAQWISLGPNSGSTKSLYYNNGILYIGLNDNPFGIYYTENAGTTWNKMGELIADVESMLKVGNTFYAVGRLNGPRVYISTDDGTTWNYSEVGTPNNNMLELTSFGTNIFVATDEGIFKSTDAGTSWVNANNSGIFLSLVASGSNLVAGGADGIFISTDGGDNWSQVSSYAANALFSDGNYIYGSHTLPPHGVLVSTDNGNTWNNYSGSFPANTIVYDFAAIGSNVYCIIFQKSVYKSTDNGQSWSFVGDISPGFVYPLSIEGDGVNLYSCYSSADANGGVYKSTDGGSGWSHTGIKILDVTALGSNSNSVYFASGPSFGRTDDDGNTWMQMGNVEGHGTRIFFNNNDIFVCTSFTLEKSTDNGNTFNRVLTAQSFDITNVSGNLFTTTFTDTYTSSDGGSTWIYIPDMYQNYVGQFAFINNHLIAASRNYWVALSYYSIDAGTTWNSIADTAFTGVTAVHVLGNSLFAANSYGIIKSTDNGINWTYASTGFPGSSGAGNVSRIISYNGVLIAAGTFGVYISTNNGGNWISFNQGLPTNPWTKDITIKDGFLYAAVFFGSIWKRNISTLSDVETKSNEIPEEFILKQNYPNPFNPTTKISWQSPVGSYQTLKVYDVLGNVVAIMVDEYKPAGSYEVEFDASKLSSGIYFYKLQTTEFSETKKMILIR